MALALVAREDGGQAVRVFLQQAGPDQSASVRALLDGEPLAAIGHGLFALPAYDPETFHVIEAEAEIAGGPVVTAHLGLGGQFGGEVGAEMTAVERALAQQFIAWVEGAHLPQSIELAKPARRWALAR